MEDFFSPPKQGEPEGVWSFTSKYRSTPLSIAKTCHQAMLVVNVCPQGANPIWAKNMILIILHKHYFLHQTSAILHLQDITVLNRFILPLLHLQNHGTRLQGTNRMPLTSRNIQSNNLPIGRKLDGLRANPLQLVIELPNKSTSQTHYCFRSMSMPMYGQRTPRLYGVQHPLALVIRTVTEVQIHSQSWTRFRLLSQII